jgi:hypothetical protein
MMITITMTTGVKFLPPLEYKKKFVFFSCTWEPLSLPGRVHLTHSRVIAPLYR